MGGVSNSKVIQVPEVINLLLKEGAGRAIKGPLYLGWGRSMGSHFREGVGGKQKQKNKNNKLTDKLTRKATFLTFLIPRINTQGGMRTENVLRDHWRELVQAGDCAAGTAQARERRAGEIGKRMVKSKVDTHLDLKPLCFSVSCSLCYCCNQNYTRNTEPNMSHPAVEIPQHLE